MRIAPVETSAEVTDDMGSKPSAEGYRQPLPHRYQMFIPRVEGVEVGQRSAADELILVVQWLWLKTPVGFVVETTRAKLAAAETEPLAASFQGTAHYVQK